MNYLIFLSLVFSTLAHAESPAKSAWKPAEIQGDRYKRHEHAFVKVDALDPGTGIWRPLPSLPAAGMPSS